MGEVVPSGGRSLVHLEASNILLVSYDHWRLAERESLHELCVCVFFGNSAETENVPYLINHNNICDCFMGVVHVRTSGRFSVEYL